MADQPTPRDALISLCGWIRLARDQHCDWKISDNGAATLVLTARLANCFQAGILNTDDEPPQPVLAYSGELWWFAQVWAHIAITSHALVLIADTPAPLLVVLPGDMPKSMAALRQAVRRCRTDWLCAPYSRHYLGALIKNGGPQHRSIARVDDLSLDDACRIPNLSVEDEPWLSELSSLFR